MAERRLARRGEGRRRADRGAAAGLGGDRDRRQCRDRAPPSFPADLRWPATSVGGGATVERAPRRRLGGARPLGRRPPSARSLAEFRRRDALAGREIGWEAPGSSPAAARWPASTSAATWWSSRTTASPRARLRRGHPARRGSIRSQVTDAPARAVPRIGRMFGGRKKPGREAQRRRGPQPRAAARPIRASSSQTQTGQSAAANATAVMNSEFFSAQSGRPCRVKIKAGTPRPRGDRAQPLRDDALGRAAARRRRGGHETPARPGRGRSEPRRAQADLRRRSRST